MDDEEIDVVNCSPPPPEETKIDIRRFVFNCDEEGCDYVGRTDRGLVAHKRHKHGLVLAPDTPKRPRQQAQPQPRPPPKKPIVKKPEEKKFEEMQIKSEERKSDVPRLLQPPQARVTTKQLLGGRRRAKATVESVEESAIKTDREASRLHDLGVISEEMPVGEYVTRAQIGTFTLDGQIDEEGSQMVVGEEVVIEQEEEEVVDTMPRGMPYIQRKFVPRQPGSGRREKSYPSGEQLPTRLTQGDPAGKYKCYIEDCHWRCTYRSLRMEHMKAVHPEWKCPPRYILERISKDGIYLNPDEYVPPIACNVDGCDWRGNFRAARSAHMRKCHPQEHADSKKKLPGYNSTGSYGCHYPMCTWRGWSRSTRSQHLRKAHPDWQPDQTARSILLLSCFHCKATFPSYHLLLTHIEQHGGTGLHVDEVFETKEAFANWLQDAERQYSIQFDRTDPVVQQNDVVHYLLQCSCSGTRGVQLAGEMRNYIYQKYNFLKRRPQQFLTRNKCDCSCFLEVREDTNYERVTVKGCLEHTGHRFGTPLLRLSPMDRQLYADMVAWKLEHEDSPRLMALDIVEKLNVYEGFMMDNYSFPKSMQLAEPMDENPLKSLKKIIDQSDATCFFNVDFSEVEKQRASFGYMSRDMRMLCKKHAPERVVTIDVCLVEFEDCEFHQYTVMVADDNYIPKCVAIYLTTRPRTAPEIVLKKIKSVNPRAPMQFLVDPSQIWVNLIESLWSDEVTILISEWTIMDYWAAKTEQYVTNEHDVFLIVTALRRLLRCEEVNQLMFITVELFEALYESGYEQLAEFFDVQYSDVEYFKRWSPVHRNSFSSHSHPTLAVASKTLRDMYLNNDGMSRVEQWFVHATKRIQEFNAVANTQTYTLRPLDPPRRYNYHTAHVPPYQNPKEDEVVVYEEEVTMEELAEGEVVEEEVIGHEEIIEEEVIYEPEVEVEQKPSTSSKIPRARQIPQIPQTSQTQRPSAPTSAGTSKQQAELKIPPHRMRAYRKEEDGEPPKRPRILAPQRGDIGEKHPQRAPRQPRKDTTKSVVRSRKRNKDKFAKLREGAPDFLKAIAAHAISYDGRRKTQEPYVTSPSHGILAQSAVPVVSSTEFMRRQEQKKLHLQNVLQRKKKPTPIITPQQQWLNARRQALEEKKEKAKEREREREERRRQRVDREPERPRLPRARMVKECQEKIEVEEQKPDTKLMPPPRPPTANHPIIHQNQLVVDHDEVVEDVKEEIEDDEDEQQPCTSASLYRPRK